MSISRRRLADSVKELHQRGLLTHSTVIFPYSTNPILELWRCRCLCSCRNYDGSVKVKVTLFNVGSSFSPEGTAINGSRRCALYPPCHCQCSVLRVFKAIDRMQKWLPINYSFIFVLISLTSLVSMRKIQKNFHTKMRLVSLISIHIKE